MIEVSGQQIGKETQKVLERDAYLTQMRRRMREIENPLNYMDNARTKQHLFHQRRMFEIMGHRFRSFTEVERFCINEGINPLNIKPRPVWIPQGGGDADVIWKIEVTR